MSFKKLRGLTESDEQKAAARKGFAERLAAHETNFQLTENRLEPGSAWYDRMYGKRSSTRPKTAK